MVKTYETPEIIFEELTFFEKIADQCWGACSVTYDNPCISGYDPHTLNISGSCGSGKNSPVNSILDFVKDYMSDDQFDDFTSRNLSSLSNTRASGFNCCSGCHGGKGKGHGGGGHGGGGNGGGGNNGGGGGNGKGRGRH
ncbi:MAG: hypothetical protein K0R34_1733 [Herbinix sp.]|nr:hypothetical protein [Herbinix sp.]